MRICTFMLSPLDTRIFEKKQSCNSEKRKCSDLEKIKLEKDLMNKCFLLDVMEFWTKDLIIYDWQVYNLSKPYGKYVHIFM